MAIEVRDGDGRVLMGHCSLKDLEPAGRLSRGRLDCGCVVEPAGLSIEPQYVPITVRHACAAHDARESALSLPAHLHVYYDAKILSAE